jgi:hypothetical protein
MNGDNRASPLVSVLGALCSCLLGILGGIVVSGTGYVTVREHAEFQKHIEDRFSGETAMITRQDEALKNSIADLQARLSSMEGKLDVALGRRK